jgi:hypothetical protein
MSTNKSEYLLLFRGEEWDKGLTPEELQPLMDKMIAWFEGLKESGVVKGGRPLAREGKTVFGPGKRMVADGPFAESKEAVGGYLAVEVDDMEAALAIAKSCPTLDRGISIEVRPLLNECPIFERAKKQMLFAA